MLSATNLLLCTELNVHKCVFAFTIRMKILLMPMNSVCTYVRMYVCVVILLSLSYSNMFAPMLKAVGFGACANDGKTMTRYLNLPEVRMLHESHACHMHITCMSHASHMAACSLVMQFPPGVYRCELPSTSSPSRTLAVGSLALRRSGTLPTSSLCSAFTQRSCECVVLKCIWNSYLCVSVVVPKSILLALPGKAKGQF